MMQKFNSKAKIILTGEHAVVYGFSAVATPVDMEMCAVIKEHSEDFLEENHELRNIIEKILPDTKLLNEFFKNYDFSILSKIPISSGFGSSAALSLCLAKIIMFIKNGFLLQNNYDKNELIMLANLIESFFHKNPSGVDVTTILEEKIIKFNSLQKYTEVKNNAELYLAAINTEKRNMLTKDAIQKLHDEKNYALFKEIGEIGEEFAKSLETADYHMISYLITENHKILKTLGCVTNKMEDARAYLLENGAIAAKMTGAGFGGAVFGLFKSFVHLKHSQVQNRLKT